VARVAFRPAFAPARLPVVQRGALQVVAAEGDKKATKKRTPAPVKRAQLAEERRMYNKARKSACATRIKKVMKMAEDMLSNPPKAEADVKPLESLINEAFQEIDKAKVKGIMHKNTAARRKARCTRWKKQVLMAAGLFVPSADHPDYARYQKLAKKSA